MAARSGAGAAARVGGGDAQCCATPSVSRAMTKLESPRRVQNRTARVRLIGRGRVVRVRFETIVDMANSTLALLQAARPAAVGADGTAVASHPGRLDDPRLPAGRAGR